jgi:prolyl oligopeptidase
MATKPNTWRDFISCAEYLVSQQYTSPAHLGAQGGSAGGILAGNALTERPDLFGAIVMNVAMTNLLRSETTANGVFNTAEFGSVKTEKGFHALRAMDAYHKVKDGVSYPAVLFQGGMNDPRVNPFFSAKMAARLQAASSSGKPVLLDFPEDMGHGIGTSQEQSSKLKADMYAFLFAQLSNLSREGEGR